jgi:FkbM family methyltransferase
VSAALGTLAFDAVARLSRTLPHFRGKWQVADVLRRLLLPLRAPADGLCRVRMKDGSVMTWDVRDAAEGRAVFLGIWDDDLRNAVCARLATGGVTLDVGASVGAWTVPLARHVGAEGMVYAFEPVPANLTRLERAVADNALARVVIVPFALGDAERTVDMWLRSSVTTASSGTAAIVAAGAGQISVTMRPLDGWIETAALPRLDFIKLDVEGSELMVLAGAERAIARFRPVILGEFDEYWMSLHQQSRADARAWAVSHGYRLLRWERRARRFVPTESPSGDATLMVPSERG